MGILSRKNNKSRNRGGIVNEKSRTIKEAYKTIRANITVSLPENGCKIIGITSAVGTEGKSNVCLNLAISFSEDGAKVLIIENLRKPNIAKLLGQKASPGISNVLENSISLEDVLRPTEYTGLEVISSGDIPTNASELLGSEKMAEVFGELAQWYDYIFVDIPPVNIVSDVIILSKYLTGVVMVIKQGKSEKRDVISAVEQLKFAKARIIGFALNGVSKRKRGVETIRYEYTSECANRQTTQAGGRGISEKSTVK